MHGLCAFILRERLHFSWKKKNKLSTMPRFLCETASETAECCVSSEIKQLTTTFIS